MALPKAKELTERELEVMHVFWDRGTATRGGGSRCDGIEMVANWLTPRLRP